ncbi:hypothetical protein ACFYZH_15455 [Streptomyces abikoensis]|uniref:hypothetical protein n=1 Tax=Streptomyces abikoensis TaxID=97398 RepID=UPI0036990F8E
MLLPPWPLHVITTAANVNDITQTLPFVGGIRPSPGDPADRDDGPSAFWATRRTTRRLRGVNCVAAGSCR